MAARLQAWIGKERTGPRRVRASAILLVVALVLATAGVAFAQGGTAKPPAVSTPSTVDTPVPPAVAAPTFADVNDIHQFDITGFLSDATVDGSICPTVTDPNLWGGHALVNGIQILVPCNSIIQMPAASVTWPELLDPSPQALTMRGGVKPSFEVSVTGNIVGDQHIAGLIYASQQSLNNATGVIDRIDYSTGDIIVRSQGGTGPQARVQINDPNGRFGRAQSPDPRFSVDDENPTIHAGTGFPMCVPRHDPSVTDDPECPQKNRPQVNDLSNIRCRNFTQAGIPLPVSGELAPPLAGQQYCGHFVMENPKTAAAGHANAWKQAPFEVGDTISYSGTQLTDADGTYISAHTVEANLGIFTQSGTLPVYTAIGEFGIGAADPAATAINGAGQETTDRIFLEAEVTDIKSVVDVYLVDKDPITGVESNRWITPDPMVGGPTNGPFLVNTTAPCSDTVRNGPTCTTLDPVLDRHRDPDGWRHHHAVRRSAAGTRSHPGHQAAERDHGHAGPHGPGGRPPDVQPVHDQPGHHRRRSRAARQPRAHRPVPRACTRSQRPLHRPVRGARVRVHLPGEHLHR